MRQPRGPRTKDLEREYQAAEQDATCSHERVFKDSVYLCRDCGARGAITGGEFQPFATAEADADAQLNQMIQGHALDLIETLNEAPDLIATDPPYAFGGSGDEHAISATVATVLRESARRLRKGRWMLVMCAASWRSTSYMVEAVRGVVDPVRIATWCKPRARTKVITAGWGWASVNVIAFRKGRALDREPIGTWVDHITAEPVMNGRRAQLPASVAEWMVRPYAVVGGLMLDPFAGSGVLLGAASDAGMRTVGYELHPPEQADESLIAADAVTGTVK